MRKALLNREDNLQEENSNIIQNKEYYTIETTTPISMETKTTTVGDISTVYWLCKLVNGKLIVLCCNYLIESEAEKESLLDRIPFHEDRTFLNNKILCNMMLSNLPTYLTDFRYNESENDKIEISAKLLKVDNDDNSSNNIVYFSMSLELFSCFSYTENYIEGNILNYHDISLAILAGVQEPELETTLYNVSDIDILSIVNIDKKKKSIAVLLRAKPKDDNKNCYNILVPFELNVKVDKKKSKGATIEKIQQNYLENEDEYVTLFIFESRIENIDKEYMFIKAKNKNNMTTIFAFDNAVKQILENKIIEF
jgi:hypothetical protein